MKFGIHEVPSARATFGERYIAKFDNGYGASIIRSQYSYGGEDGLWEVAVLGPDGGISYDTGLTDDVLGRLNEDNVAKTLDDIAALSADAIAENIRRQESERREERIVELEEELASLKSQRSEVSA